MKIGRSGKIAQVEEVMQTQSAHQEDSVKMLQNIVWEYYWDNHRSMPWRPTFKKTAGAISEKISSPQTFPYHVFISEIMLQQTQVARVIGKFAAFIDRFPSFDALASASTADVLTAWQGMGYNRRGLYLLQSARRVVEEYGGMLPEDPIVLKTFPGLGPATAASLLCFAYNKPVVFIETNIRRVFIHHFFNDQEDLVHDRDIVPIVARALDQVYPRQWYYALMDYGSHLATTVPNPNRRSRHYARQSAFEGSVRQVRGAILRTLTKHPQGIANDALRLTINDERFDKVIAQLEKEKLVKKVRSKYVL
jgi:A/G-specific adenine glycosylase